MHKKIQNTHGGKRKGSGRKGFGGTTLVRVPNGILKLIKKMIADWKKSTSTFRKE